LSSAPNTPGPDDNYKITFPQTGAVWSDLSLSSNGFLYAALGSPLSDTNVTDISANAVYRNEDPTSNAPIWYIGDPGSPPKADAHSGSEFPNGGARNSTIRIATAGDTIYAAITDPATGGLLEIQKSSDGGKTWKATTVKPPNYLGSQGDYDSTLVAVDANTVYMGGVESNDTVNYTQGEVYVTTDGFGATKNLTDISIDSKNNGPHSDFHAMALDVPPDPSLKPTLVIGSDGGVWRLDPNNGNLWSDLNSNLQITQFNSIAVNPSDPNSALGASQDNGTEQYTGGQSWNLVDLGDGGLVRIDPENPQNAYHVLNGVLQKSTQGGAANTWNTILQVPGDLYFPFVVDQVNPSRLVVGSHDPLTNIMESLDGGSTWTDLTKGAGATSVAVATYQGNYQTDPNHPTAADPSFPLVGDIGVNTYDPNTIYAVIGYGGVLLTKDHGTTWVNRNDGLPTDSIVDLAVDPRNRNTAYVVRSVFGGQEVFKTTTAGLSFNGKPGWFDITNNLPNTPVYKVVIDPRTGNIYLGTDLGVFVSTNGGTSWKKFGLGLPITSVQDLVINQSLNTLAVGTYGRGMYQIWLDDSQANAGALRSLSGNAVWTGPVSLTGDTTISADGTQAVQNGLAAATLTIVGTIGDVSATGASHLTKIGQGNVVFSGANTYGGTTEVQQGVLVVDNAQALGSPSAGTTVDAGAALELQSDLQGEPLSLAGDGVLFNGHYTGALRNVSGSNTFTGTITLLDTDPLTGNSLTNTTIGVDSGSSLTVTGGSVSGPADVTLTKELPGTLVLAAADPNLNGAVKVVQGALRVMDPQALGTTASGTTVLDGAQLQIQGGITVTGEPLTLSGTGIFNTGALFSTGGANTWQGPVNLTSLPNFNPATTPDAGVVINVATVNPGDQLTIDGVISESLASALTKIGSGKLVETKTNTYSGTTYVNNGILSIQDPGALGTNSSAEVQRLTVGGDTSGTFALTFNGKTTDQLPFNAPATGLGSVQSALDGLSTIGGSTGGSVNVSMTTISTPTPTGTQTTEVYTITFLGSLAGVQQPLLGVTTIGGTIATVTKVSDGGIGTLVSNGATLQLDLDPKNTGTAQTVSGETLALNGSGAGGIGALDNLSGSNTWSAAITLQSSSSIKTDAGTQLTSSGGINSAASADLSKIGTGTLAFAAANPNLLGQVFVNEGVLSVQNSGALGATTAGTTVASGATLQLSGTSAHPIFVIGEPLTISGNGFNNAGALDSVNAGNDWQGPITLAANASFGATGATDSLVLDKAITDGGHNFGVTKLGQGLVVYAGGAGTANTYTGLTQVNAGRLELAKGDTAVAGDLSVGSGNGTTIDALAFWAANDQLATTSSITVKSDGVADLVSYTNTVQNVTMTGGGLNLTAPTSQLTLNGNVTGTSAGSGSPAIMGGLGTLVLAGSNPTFTVTQSGNPPDMVVDPVIAGSHGLTKAGNGWLVLTAKETYTGTTTVLAGTLDVDGPAGQIGDVSLSGGTLAGSGTVGAVTATSTGGTLHPGDNIGILNASGDVTLNSASTFSVNLNGTTLGTDYGELVVNGNVNLGTATLAVVVGNNFVPKAGVDTFTLIQTTGTGHTITGEFAQGTTMFLNGIKFQVTYNSTSVTLQRVKASTSTGVTSSGSPSVYGQNVTFTATVTPETGTTGPIGGTVDFVIDGTTVATGVTLMSDGTATYATATLGVQATAHTVTANFHDTDGNFADSSGSLSGGQTVTVAATTTAVTADHNPSFFGQTVTFTATVSAAHSTIAPTGTVDFVIDGTAVATGVGLTGGVATYSTSTLSVAGSPHSVTVNYHNSDGNFTNSSGSLANGQTVNTSATTITVATTNANAQYGQAAITATVAPSAAGTVNPTGNVTFTVTGTQAFTETDALSSGVATLQRLLIPGTYTITASYAGDGNFTANNNSNSLSQTVTKADTSTAVTADSNPSVYSQTVTFTATVSPKYAGTPGGTVDFVIDGTTVATGVPLSGGTATYVTSSLTVSGSPHSVTANFHATDGNFNDSSGSLSGGQTVNKANADVVLSSNNNPDLLGQSITFTATVSAASPSSGTPTGKVDFLDGTTLLDEETLANVGGQQQVSFTTSSLSQGLHTITAKYLGDSNFNSQTSDVLDQKVRDTTATSVTADNNPSVYGQNVTFTATVTPTQSSPMTPGGSVQFFDGTTSLGTEPLATVGTKLQASITVAVLTPGTHTITATYLGDNNFNTSSGTVSGGQVVNQDGTTTAIATTNSNAPYGVAKITATVTQKSPGTITPTGTVTFTIVHGTTTTQETDSLVGGVATLQPLNASSTAYTISATYNADDVNGGFTGSSSGTISQTVTQVTTTTQLDASPNPAVVGQAVTFTATVSCSGSTGAATGTVRFFDGSTQIGGDQTLQTVGGKQQASITVSNLAVSPPAHSITAEYLGDTNCMTSTSNDVSETINAADTTTVVSASPSSPTYGQPVTFTATVTVKSPGAGTPRGTVSFFDGLTQLGQAVSLQTVGGKQQASLTTGATDLAAGPHSITAVYSDTVDSNFNGSTSAALSLTVQQAATSTTLVSSKITPVVGRPVTFTATVSTVMAGLGTPTGTVTFSVDGVPVQENLVSGVGTLTRSDLALGHHTVTATFNSNGNYTGSTSNTLSFPVYTPNQGFVAQAYRDLLHREADATGLALFSGLLDQGVLNRYQVVSALESSAEYRAKVIDALYVHYLHRHADPVGLAAFQAAMANGFTDEMVASTLIGSPEYFNNRGNGTVDGFLTALYSDALNRALDSMGEQSFSLALAFNVSRQQVAQIILGSPEYEQNLVTGFYNTYLHRAPDSNGLSGMVAALAQGATDEAIIAGLMGSDEYFFEV
jgi:autotransporter-associated beta strand protein